MIEHVTRTPSEEPAGPARPALEDAHALGPGEVALRLGVDVDQGLPAGEAVARMERYGPNELEPPKRVSLLATIAGAATEPFIVLLAFAGGLAVALGEVRDGLLVLGGLIPIVGAGVITEYRAERALEELRQAAAPTGRVRRDGTLLEVPAREIVPGDVVLLRVGDVVPADLKIVGSSRLTIDTSVVTGESLPEEASLAPDPADALLADRRSIALAGTSIVIGRGEGLVVGTGRLSELGRIARGLGPADRGRSPLQRELDRLVRILLVVAIGLIVITVSLGLIRGRTLGEAILAGISAAIAAIPEEPPILLAVVLGLGAYRLLRRGVLVRRLNAQETLGAIDLIITDKTGTLTENRLRLEGAWTPDGRVDDGPERAALLRDALRAEEDAWIAGSPRGSFTKALFAAAGGEAAMPLDRRELISAEPPLDGRPWSSTTSRSDGEVHELALGAPEALLPLLGAADERVRGWWDLVDRQATAGRRLLLLVRRAEGGQAWEPRAILAFADPLRAGVPDALASAEGAGIQTIVVTGDHPATAAAVAGDANLRTARIVTGRDLDAWDDERLARELPGLDIVARAVPEQKLRLVKAARRQDRTVAVTGDGVNDAPALQQADVGVAMGSGTAVAREAADLVLGDDSFVTLMDGLREGRRIVANVQKGLVFLVSTHVALLGFILMATLAGFDQPLLPIQILWLELFIDITASVAFEREPAEPDVMDQPPRPKREPLLTSGLLVRVAVAGSITAGAALALMAWHDGTAEHARWVAFNALVFGQLVRAYANRSLAHPVHRRPQNRLLAVAVIGAAVVQLAIPVVPPLAEAFRATPLDAMDLSLVALIALGPAIVAEVVRARRRQVWVA